MISQYVPLTTHRLNPSSWTGEYVSWSSSQHSKTNPAFPDFKHKINKEASWICECYSPRQVQEELGERGVRPARELWLAKKTRSPKETHHRVHQKEDVDVLIVKDGNHKISQDEATAVVASLQACIKQKDLQRGRRIHDNIVKKGLLENHAFVGNALVTMYAKCSALDKAQELFDNLLIRNVVSWNTLIAGYAQHALGEKALNCFQRMQSEGFSPNPVTFICILKACCSIGALDKGQEIH
eukprot:c19309_g1_i1 orf=1-717(-)